MVGFGNLERVRRMRAPFEYTPARLLVRILFALNVVGFVAALALLSLAIWSVCSEMASMVHLGTQIALFVASASVAMLSLTGVVGLLRSSRAALLAFTLSVALVLAGQLGAFSFYVGWRDAAADAIDSMWGNATPEMRSEIQAALECCGFRTPTDAPGPNCAPEWTSSCSDVIHDVLTAQRALIITLIVVIVTIEAASLAIAGYLLHILPTDRDLQSLAIEEEWLKSLGINDGEEEEGLLNGVY